MPFTLNESEEDRSISNSRPVQLLMENCRKDYKRYEELLLVLKDNYPEVSSNVLTSFIHDLVSNDFLISDLRPPLCNINPLDYLVSKLEDGKLKNDLNNLKIMIENYKGIGNLIYLQKILNLKM